jgi:phospholipid transport system transporter-binding protein
MTIATVKDENKCLYIAGDLNFQTVMQVWKDSLPLMNKYSTLNLDFSGVKQANSAALALLLEWLHFAKQCQKPISFNQLPAQLRSIASVAGIEELL